MFDAILPTLILDLTDLLDDSGHNFSDCFFFLFQFPVLCLLYFAGSFCSTFSPETVQHLSDCG